MSPLSPDAAAAVVDGTGLEARNHDEVSGVKISTDLSPGPVLQSEGPRRTPLLSDWAEPGPRSRVGG